MDVHTRPSHSRMFDRPGHPHFHQPSLSPPPLSPPPPPPPDSHVFDMYKLVLTRAVLAGGMVYYWTEYVMDITLCEGPSMMPTIQPMGEIVLIDKCSVRIFGLQGGGCIGDERAQQARARQEAFIIQQEQQQQQQQNTPPTNQSPSHDVWHEPYISVSDKDRLTWTEAISHILSPLSVGDVVVVKHPARKSSVCKRVLGLPGDTILHRGLFVVPDGHVWLEGDHPMNSSDSRHYGPVPLALVVGRVVARWWPLRGNAWMVRGGRPHPPATATAAVKGSAATALLGSTVLPAGYEGQEILKKRNQNEE